MLTAFLIALLSTLAVPTDSTDGADRQSELLAAVRSYARPFDADWDSTATHIAWVDLNGDGREDALVSLTDNDWCGSGGCTILVFEAMDEADAEEFGAYRPAAEISRMHGPVHVALAARGAWSDLIVEDATGVMRRLSFDGETYPLSPTAGSVLRGAMPPGVTLFADAR